MLVLTRKLLGRDKSSIDPESVIRVTIGDAVVQFVALSRQGNKVRLGVIAPADAEVLREEKVGQPS